MEQYQLVARSTWERPHTPSVRAILIMTEFSLLREAPALKPPKATSKPYTRHILGIDSGLQSHPKATTKPHHSHTTATPKPHQSHTKATPQPHHSHTKATPKPTTQAISKAGGRGNRLFSQGLGHNENCCLRAPSVPLPVEVAEWVSISPCCHEGRARRLAEWHAKHMLPGCKR